MLRLVVISAVLVGWGAHEKPARPDPAKRLDDTRQPDLDSNPLLVAAQGAADPPRVEALGTHGAELGLVEKEGALDVDREGVADCRRSRAHPVRMTPAGAAPVGAPLPASIPEPDEESVLVTAEGVGPGGPSQGLDEQLLMVGAQAPGGLAEGQGQGAVFFRPQAHALPRRTGALLPGHHYRGAGE